LKRWQGANTYADSGIPLLYLSDSVPFCPR